MRHTEELSRVAPSGTQIHRVLETFEFMSTGLQRQGIAKNAADRVSMAMALKRNGGCTSDQAREVALELYPREDD